MFASFGRNAKRTPFEPRNFAFSSETLRDIAIYFKKLSKRKLKQQPEKLAAVFVPLCMVDNVPSILYTKRSEILRKHGGQVSFPGGVIEKCDGGDPIKAAIRETEEELGLQTDRSDNHLLPLATYHQMLSTSSIGVTPVLGFIDKFDIQTMKPNYEVDQIFSIPIKDLLDPSKQEERPEDSREVPGAPILRNRPHYKIYTAAPWPVWGLTSYITEQILTELLKQKEK